MTSRILSIAFCLALLTAAGGVRAQTGEEAVPPQCRGDADCGLWAYLTSEGPASATVCRPLPVANLVPSTVLEVVACGRVPSAE